MLLTLEILYFCDMIASPSEIAELERFFETNHVPQRIKLNAATTVHDVPAFIRRTIENLRKLDISETALRPRYDDLILIKSLVEKASST